MDRDGQRLHASVARTAKPSVVDEVQSNLPYLQIVPLADIKLTSP
jgi:hypothetical protein